MSVAPQLGIVARANASGNERLPRENNADMAPEIDAGVARPPAHRGFTHLDIAPGMPPPVFGVATPVPKQTHRVLDFDVSPGIDDEEEEAGEEPSGEDQSHDSTITHDDDEEEEQEEDEEEVSATQQSADDQPLAGNIDPELMDDVKVPPQACCSKTWKRALDAMMEASYLSASQKDAIMDTLFVALGLKPGVTGENSSNYRWLVLDNDGDRFTDSLQQHPIAFKDLQAGLTVQTHHYYKEMEAGVAKLVAACVLFAEMVGCASTDELLLVQKEEGNLIVDKFDVDRFALAQSEVNILRGRMWHEIEQEGRKRASEEAVGKRKEELQAQEKKRPKVCFLQGTESTGVFIVESKVSELFYQGDDFEKALLDELLDCQEEE